MSDDWDDGSLDEVDQDDGTIDCPYCGRSILEDAEYCPSCDRWMTDEDMPKPAQSLWIIVGIALCLAVALTWILRP